MVITRLFGATAATDAFVVAFRIPNFMRRLFAEGAFSLAFVPVLNEYRETRSSEALKELVDRVAGTLLAILAMVVGVLVVAAPAVVSLFAPGFTDDPETYDLAVRLLRWTGPYVGFISLVAMAGGVLNTFGRFAVPALTPILLNVALISGAVWGASALETPIMGLGWGVFVAGVAQLLFQLPALRAIGQLPVPRWGWNHPGVRRIRLLMIPTLIGSSVAQINLLIDTAIATLLDEGSNYWLYLSDRLLEFPLGVFAIALSTVILPGLSKQFAGGDQAGFGRSLDWGLRLTWLIGVPAAAGLFVLATPLISTLFEHDQFDAYGTAMAARSLAALALGLPAWMLIKVLAPAFYSRQDTRSPVRAAIIAMIANVVLNVVIVFVVMDPNAPGRHAGLALASSISGWLNLSLLWWFLIRGGYYRTDFHWLGDWLRVCIATVGMVALLAWQLPEPEQWTAWVWYERVLELGLLVGMGIAVYGVSIIVLGLRFRTLIDRP